jgi:hypothetical protein
MLVNVTVEQEEPTTPPKTRIKVIEEMVLRYRHLPMKPLICLCKLGFKEQGIIDIKEEEIAQMAEKIERMPRAINHRKKKDMKGKVRVGRGKKKIIFEDMEDCFK